MQLPFDMQQMFPQSDFFGGRFPYAFICPLEDNPAVKDNRVTFNKKVQRLHKTPQKIFWIFDFRVQIQILGSFCAAVNRVKVLRFRPVAHSHCCICKLSQWLDEPPLVYHVAGA